MTREIIITALLIALIYLYYQNRKLRQLPNTQTIHEVGEDHEDLIADKDEAIRKKNEAEAEALDLSNKLKLKQQEVNRKDQEITRLKDEKSKVETALNEKIKELKKKYSEQGKLLDEEQLENNKLVSKIEQLETKITELEKERTNLLKELEQEEQLTDFWNWLQENQAHQADLKDWKQVINFLKNQHHNFYLVEGNWSEGWTKSNKDHFKVFSKWLKNKDNSNNHD